VKSLHIYRGAWEFFFLVGMVLGSNCRIRVWGGHKIASFVRGVISRGSDMDFDYHVITIHNLSFCVSDIF
jgi:hypothetical protein